MSIFGAGLLDILNQGGQFLAGRQAGQKAKADAEYEKQQKAALQQALIEQYHAQANEQNARAVAALGPKIPTVQEQVDQATGQLAPYAGKEAPAGFDPTGAAVSNTIAHLGFKNVDPNMLYKVAQDRQDKLAAQQPVMGSPAWIAAQDTLGQIRRKYAPPKDTTATDNTLANNLAGRFQQRTKTTTDNLQALNQASAVLHQADIGNRAAYGSAIANFVQASDQKAQLRSQMLQYFASHVDPSLAGKWDIVEERLRNGTWPTDVLKGMRDQIDTLKQLNMSRYNQLRAGEVSRHPQLEEWLPQADEFIGNADQAAGPNGPVPNGPKPSGAAPVTGLFHDLIPGGG